LKFPSILIELASCDVTGVFSAFGKIGVSAERVAEQAARDAREYLVSRAIAGKHLADQLLLPVALAKEGSFTATKLSMHLRTNMEVIHYSLGSDFEIQQEKGLARVSLNTLSKSS